MGERESILNPSVTTLMRDCVELAECAHKQAGCPENCGCTDCDLYDAVYRLARALAPTPVRPVRDAGDEQGAGS